MRGRKVAACEDVPPRVRHPPAFAVPAAAGTGEFRAALFGRERYNPGQ